MNRYIDADKLMLDIRLDKRPTFRGAKIPPSVKETMFAYLDSAPHIDIVRCKECKKAHLTHDGVCKYCDEQKDDDDNYIEVYHDGDHFCSYGEREGE